MVVHLTKKPGDHSKRYLLFHNKRHPQTYSAIFLMVTDTLRVRDPFPQPPERLRRWTPLAILLYEPSGGSLMGRFPMVTDIHP